jgi:tryptophanyl-tRNA synthetase
MATRKRALTGIQPSGDIHVGNYLGAIRPGLQLQNEYDCLFFVPDLHSLTTTKDAVRIREQTYGVVATWIALGLDTARHIMYRQSDLPMVAEFAWYLSCSTGLGLLEKGHAFKDAQAQAKDINHGVFAYPVLMAADILMYDADVVPVGLDQKQHVEMARDMAGSFNANYGDLLKLPEVRIDERVMKIPGLDGRKMSKSYDNTIPLFAEEKAQRKKIMSIKTDSTPVDAPKQLQGSLLGDLYTLFATPAQVADLEKRLAAGGLGWGHAKEELFAVINDTVNEPRKYFNELLADKPRLDKILHEGAARAYDIALPVLNRVRKAVGFSPFSYVQKF